MAEEGSRLYRTLYYSALRNTWFGTFEEMGLKDELLQEIKNYGYEEPTAVQQRIIVPLYRGNNLRVDVAESEPGKTSAICLGILQKLECDLKECQAIILTANPFMACEIGKDMRKLGASLQDLRVHVLGEDLPGDSSGVHVYVGTLIDSADWLENSGGISWTKHIKVVVVDNADVLCGMPQIFDIFRRLLPLRDNYQICIVSDREYYADNVRVLKNVEKFVTWWMPSHEVVHVPSTFKPEEGNRRHHIISVGHDSMKPYWLLRLYNRLKTTSVVFVEDLETVEYLVMTINEQKWENPKWKVLSTHDNMNQRDRDRLQRELLLQEAEEGSLPKVLITTEEWAIGINLKQVELVVNYHLPVGSSSDYLRRMRLFGGGADAINFITRDEWSSLIDFYEESNGAVVFEGTPVQSYQVGPAGFSKLPEMLPGGPSKGVEHMLYPTEVDYAIKRDMLCDEFSAVLKQTRSVVFANVDLTEQLRGMGLAVFKVEENLDGFCGCQEDGCILLITSDADTTKVSAKVPLVINFDLPSEIGIYNDRVAWCQRNGLVIHFVSDDDWFKTFHFQSPPQSVLSLFRLQDALAVLGANSKSTKSSAKRLKLMEPKANRHFLDEPQLPESTLVLPPEPVELWDPEEENKMVVRFLGPKYANVFA